MALILFVRIRWTDLSCDSYSFRHAEIILFMGAHSMWNEEISVMPVFRASAYFASSNGDAKSMLISHSIFFYPSSISRADEFP